MYFGSVKFFKHLIIASLVLIVTLVVGGLSFVVYNYASDFMQFDSLPDTAPGGAQALEPTDPEDLETESSRIEIVKINPFEGMVVAPYQDKYPEMYSPVEFPEKFTDNKGVAFLTFDDGPSERTVEILDILKEYNVKATFFVVGNYLVTDRQKAIVKRAFDEGHTIAVHTNTHEYKEIYASVDAYLEDFNQVYTKLYDITGEYPSIFRFPGGTVNSFNKLVYKDIAREMLRRGFLYYDWHSSSNDTLKITDPATLAANAMKGANGGQFIILSHDSASKKGTVASVPRIIEGLRKKGYTFDRLTNTVMPIAFGVPELPS